MPEEVAGGVEPTTPYLSVVVPAFNEEARIGASLKKMLAYFDGRGYEYDILVVDDGSTDGTREIVEAAIQEHPNLRILHYDGNRGKGYAVRYGMLQATGNFVLFSDADLATPIEEEQKLFDAIRQGADIAIGSRDIPGSKLERRQSILREMGGKLFNRCVQWIAVPGIRDTQCGFKLFTRAAAHNIFSRCEIDNFSFDVEVLYLGRLLGYKIVEVPVRWAHQEGSKVRFLRDGLRMLRTLCCIRATNYRIEQVDYKRSSAP
ncbi:MAG TPA: dolichyl-phosphate beta-glucosyltransferase [Chthonomonadales bacterium]|nr:dolichyl-phosphate beta-glucosyltransferase [Chthonomonadales bacterium]